MSMVKVKVFWVVATFSSLTSDYNSLDSRYGYVYQCLCDTVLTKNGKCFMHFGHSFWGLENTNF